MGTDDDRVLSESLVRYRTNGRRAGTVFLSRGSWATGTFPVNMEERNAKQSGPQIKQQQGWLKKLERQAGQERVIEQRIRQAIES